MRTQLPSGKSCGLSDMHAPLPHPVDAAVMQLRVALFVYLHELRWDEDANHPHRITIKAELSPAGALEAEIHAVNTKTGEQWGASL